MKKIAENQLCSITEIDISGNINPQQSETRCKICFEEKFPLVTLCDCTGSIAYVHEDCILDWIELKMEKSENIEIPKCEICKSKFSATMKIGSKKIDNVLLLQRLKTTKKQQWLIFGLLGIGFIVSILTLIIAIFNLLTGSSIDWTSAQMFVFSFIKTCFKDFIFPSVFLDYCMKYFKKKWKIIDECKVQLVEVTLLPKKILKS